MKRLLITGANSYIGESFVQYISAYHPDWHVDTVDMIGNMWRKFSFSGYDSVFHVAGIAHQKETKRNAPLYFSVNRDLALDVARKAKKEGVQQFIFLSSMSVYGIKTGAITTNTPLKPKSPYGMSKLQAEKLLQLLADDTFKVAILRPPMVYGKNCKGNFQTVVKLVKTLPVFPKLDNHRSMLYIHNLCACVADIAAHTRSGLFLPQDPECMNTSQMAVYIAEGLGKPLRLSRLLGFAVKLLMPFVTKAKKAFGSLVYVSEEEPCWTAAVTSCRDAVIDSV